MNMQSATSSEDLTRLAIAVSDIVQIEQIGLIEFSAMRQPEIEVSAVAIKHAAPEVAAQFDSQTKRIKVKAKFGVEGSDSAGYEPRTILRIHASFLAIYALEPSDSGAITPEQTDAFGKVNGLFNIWPYWRELVQSITTRMALPPLTLPVLHVTEIALRGDAKKEINPQSITSERKKTPRKSRRTAGTKP